uniref:Uncharacterized protein n=1 Tax=Aegilops tauschii subsp. strangulata TaxID=200361 RepID=A0A453GCJ4_AEGTS
GTEGVLKYFIPLFMVYPHHHSLFFRIWILDVFLIVHLLFTSARLLPIVCVRLWSKYLDFIHEVSTLHTPESISTNRTEIS